MEVNIGPLFGSVRASTALSSPGSVSAAKASWCGSKRKRKRKWKRKEGKKRRARRRITSDCVGWLVLKAIFVFMTCQEVET